MHTPPNYPVIPAKFWISFLGWGDIVSKVWKLVTLCESNFSVVFPFFTIRRKVFIQLDKKRENNDRRVAFISTGSTSRVGSFSALGCFLKTARSR